MAEVSIYPHIKETKEGAICDLPDILDLIREGRWKDRVLPIMQRAAEGATEAELSDLKAKLPYFTGSGTFGANRDLANFLHHSGKLIIDFDKVEDHEVYMEVLIKDKYSEYVFKSCTGRGYAVVVSIDKLRHLESFLFLEKYYAQTYGTDQYKFKIDKSCKDIPRPRYVSYDPDLFHNPHAVFVALPSPSIDSDEEKYKWVVTTINKKNSFVEGNRHHYLVVLCHFLNKCGVDYNYALGNLISEFSSADKSPDEITKIAKYCYANSIDFGTFTINKKIKDLPPEFSRGMKSVFKFAHKVNREGREYAEEDIRQMCAAHLLSYDVVKGIFEKVKKDHADEFNLLEQPEIYQIELFIKKRYDIIKNEVLNQVECRDKGKGEFKLVNEDSIHRELQYVPFKFPLDKLKSLLRSDYVETYNPFLRYFEGLQAWNDGDTDYINEMASFVKVDNQAFWETQFKKSLVRTIACAIEHRENRIVMTLIGGDQETGKTNFIRFLCPQELKKYYTEAAMTDNKDSDIQLSENIFWNLEELSALSNIEVNKLKAIISKSIVKQRHAFGRHAESHPRRVTFWASTNKDEFLTDDQNTRWLCFNVKGIDHDYNNFKTNVRKVDINKVWAQAYALYHAGFDYTLTKEEAAQRDQINKAYELSSTEKELILTYYKVCPAGSGKFMHVTDIFIELDKHTNHKLNLKPFAISKALKQIGFAGHIKKVAGKPVRGFFVAPASTMPGDTEIQYDADPEAPKPPKPF